MAARKNSLAIYCPCNWNALWDYISTLSLRECKMLGYAERGTGKPPPEFHKSVEVLIGHDDQPEEIVEKFKTALKRMGLEVVMIDTGEAPFMGVRISK
jgi:hypothetical protein